ncbi:MAG: alcohol dehydrogenase catalytic domain-containing protein [Propionicimonas sp.]|uniref:alcohol dehydrogenase catalytic domain-containing protein n=1 Tax=Propionicimonas sp. TaxID=1955623 RepID=UPI002B201044|nr:alcohol dehydrogenase catalytic domain-containing protein [Propionicimonas sp.]MEA4944602.1 alcohol dehydrogenase catalytic domain-containing protein [Propionicimonas sp.]
MSAIPATQYAIQFTGKDEVFVNTAKPVDKIGPTQILLEVEACGICFSDTKLLHAFADHPRKSPVVAGLAPEVLAEVPGYHPNAEPTVPGHEPVVHVVAVGDQVTHYRVGERLLVQADWRHLPTAASNGAFGYNFEGALQQYVVVDERIVVHQGEEFMLRVSDRPTAAQVALVEPWSTVEASYSRSERNTLKAGGRLLVVADAGVTPSGLEPLLAAARPGSIEVVGADPAVVDSQAVVAALDAVAAGVDDIVYFGSDAATIEQLSALLGARSLLCVVLAGATIDRRVQLDVGRVHYDFTRYIGTTGTEPAEAYTHIPAKGEIRAQDKVAIIGAAGPMGLMHTVRTVSLGLPDVSVVGADVNDERLAHLAEVVNPTAAERGVPFQVINSISTPLEPGYSYLTCLVPVPALLAQAVDLASDGAIVNAFAGFPAGTLAELDLQGIIERHIFLLGTSGSEMSDMRSLLAKLETGALDTSISLDAVCGMAGFSDAIDAVNNRTSGGKIMVYPQLHDLGLVRLAELPEKLPEVAAAMDGGRWTHAAEEALLATAD